MSIFDRQINIFNPYDYNEGITIIGLGTVGSFSLLALRKMGIRKFQLFDDDIIAIHNIPNQYYNSEQIGDYKVDSSMKNIYHQNLISSEIETNKKFTKQSNIKYEIVVGSVDNMETRRIIFKRFIESYNCMLLIDPRVAREMIHIYTACKRDIRTIESYRKTLHDDTNIPCGERGIIYNAFLTASFICNIVKRYLKKEYIPSHIVFDFSIYYFNEAIKLYCSPIKVKSIDS